MPTYDYQCLGCSYEFEKFSKIDERLNVRCPWCESKVKILLSLPTLALFQPGWWEDAAPYPVYCSTPQELREVCDKYGGVSRYLAESSVWRTSPGESEDEREARESRDRKDDYQVLSGQDS